MDENVYKKLSYIRMFAIRTERGIDGILNEKEPSRWDELVGDTLDEKLDDLHYDHINAMHALILQIKRLRKEGE